LSAERRALLLEFAEFLAQRAVCRGAARSGTVPARRPANETVVKSDQRLTRTYPMLDRRNCWPRLRVASSST